MQCRFRWRGSSAEAGHVCRCISDKTGCAPKEERKAGEGKLVEVGWIFAEIVAARKRNTFHQEDHQGDCGSDLGPLEENVLVSAFVVDGSLVQPSRIVVLTVVFSRRAAQGQVRMNLSACSIVISLRVASFLSG